MSSPLAGMHVLELAEYGFVPAAAAVLADWGADVVKVERPGGDPLRGHARIGLTAGGDFDVSVEHFNRNKRGIVLDLRSPHSRPVLERLVRWADVVVTSHLPAARRRLRVDAEHLQAINPALIHARGSDHGQRGPDAEVGGFDSVSFWSRGGGAYMLSPIEGPVTMPRPALGDGPCGMFLAGGIAAAIARRAISGEASVVHVSLFSGAVWTLTPDITSAALTGEEPPRPKPGASGVGRRLRTEGCIFAPVASPSEVVADPQVIANGYLAPRPGHPVARLATSPVQFDEHPVRVTRAAPQTGEHTAEVLSELGFGAAEQAALAKTGVLG